MAAQILLDAGDSAWVEDPAYAGITAIFDSLFRDRHMIRVPVADDGIDVAAGVRLAADARAAFVTPSHQYPLGMPMSMAKRSALLAWAKERQAWIVEDDYDSEMRYAGHPFPSLQAGARTDALSRHLQQDAVPFAAAGLRRRAAAAGRRLCGARILMDRHPPSADQHVLAAFIAEGYLDRHIRKMRGVYAEKRRVLIEAINTHIP